MWSIVWEGCLPGGVCWGKGVSPTHSFTPVYKWVSHNTIIQESHFCLFFYLFYITTNLTRPFGIGDSRAVPTHWLRWPVGAVYFRRPRRYSSIRRELYVYEIPVGPANTTPYLITLPLFLVRNSISGPPQPRLACPVLVGGDVQIRASLAMLLHGSPQGFTDLIFRWELRTNFIFLTILSFSESEIARVSICSIEYTTQGSV
jgi:hypothetical protein